MRLDAERWDRAQQLFHAALALPEEERPAFLRRSVPEDEELRRTVLSLLDADARSTTPLDRRLETLAGDVLERDPLPYDRVGPYRLAGVLGRGGMGVVYLGVRDELGQKAAIKILRDAALSPARRERFAAEQRTLASLTHPAIARLYDTDVLPDGTPYFVMEHVEGVPLTEYCRSGSRSLRERMVIFREVCEAVQAAHRQAIIHRDLKPSNILVEADGRLKLLDFGIAKQLDGLDGPADPTLTLARLMTPAYAAPEQVRGEAVGIYTDIYALGVILFELLTGRLPFDLSGMTPAEAERAVVDGQPPRPSLARGEGGVPARPPVSRGEWADLDVLCLTAMHRDPQRRYRTVQGLIRDLEHFMRGEPLDARPDSLGYRLGKLVRRHSRAVAASAAALVAVVALVAFYTVRLTAARDAAMAEAARTQRIQSFMLDLFQGGDEAAGPSDTLRVLTLIERGAREAAALEAEPAVQAELLQTLGGLYQGMGSLERADTLLLRALELRRATAGRRSPEVARGLVALGTLRVGQARLEEAESLIREGLDIARRALPPHHAGVLEATTALGRVLQEKGEYEEAVALLEEVVRERGRSSPESTELSAALGELANTHFYAGQYEASDSLNRILLEMDRRLFGSHHPSVADDLINLGAIQFQWGRYAEAERHYREALAIMEAHYGPEHPETASNLTLLGRALNYQGRGAEAQEHLRRALAIQVELFGTMHPAVASTENDIGLIALVSGDLDSAEESFLHMAAIYDSVHAEAHWLKGIARSNLAAVYLEARRYPEAETLFREAAGIFTETLGPQDMNTGIARIKLGRALLAQERWAEAERESLGGYEILVGKTEPGVSWLQSARRDLASAYNALGRPADAERFRSEAEQYAESTSGS